jgi:purine-binding chemotaxis protein CheW
MNEPEICQDSPATVAEPDQRLLDTLMMDKLQLRTTAMAQPPNYQCTQTIEVLRFNIGTERYAIESCYVDQVLPIQQITALFDLPPFMRGICYVCGKVVSVLDLRLMFQLPGTGLNDRNLLLVLRHQQMEFGVLADAIVGIQTLDVSGLQHSLPNLDPLRTRYLQGITPEQTVLLDGKALLTDPELIICQGSTL